MDSHTPRTGNGSQRRSQPSLSRRLVFWKRHGSLMRRGLMISCALLLMLPRLWPMPADADDDSANPAPIGRFVTLVSPIEDEAIGFIKQTAFQLQHEADRDGRKAYLVLEIRPGTSQFYNLIELGNFLTSPEMADVVTVAWIPEEVTGNNAVIALACREVLMHPEASLGDIGRGERLEEGEQGMVRQIVEDAHNLRINPALAQAMMDPSVSLVQVSVEDADGVVEKRILTDDEVQELRDGGAIIRESRTLKEAGTAGIFTANFARQHDFLISGTAASRREVADAFSLPAESMREAALPSEQEQHVSLISVTGDIDETMATFLERQVDRALNVDTNTLVFEFDSSTGLLTQTNDLAIRISRLSEDKVRTIAWISKEATGEAAIVALACDEIYLAPGAELGDIRSGDPAESDNESVRFVRDALTELAEAKERPLGVMRAMAVSNLPIFKAQNRNTGDISYMSDDELDLAEGEWERIQQVPGSGAKRLTLDGELATELLVADGEVEDFEALQERLGLPLDVKPLRLEKTWVDDLVFVLNRPEAVGLLFFIGIICVYLELHFTTGALGLLAVLCFALFFWSKVMGGTAGQLEILLFVIGLVCIGLEIFVMPGFGVFGVIGALLVIASLVMASQTFGNIEPNRDIYEAGRTFATFGASILAVILMAAALSRFLPRIPFLSELILTPPGMNEMQSPDEPRLKRELVTPTSDMVGQSGSALSMLRPSGKAVIGGKVVDVFSEGPLIPEGAPIEVVAVSGMRITVRQIS